MGKASKVVGLLAAGTAVYLAPLAAVRAAPEAPADEPETLTEAVERCRATGLTGWPLVEHARRLVDRRFVEYSLETPWEPPGAAFRHGRGYCAQYNLALAELLTNLGIEARPVFAARVRMGDTPWWRMGHVWLKVRVDGRTREVCARYCDAPGEVRFTPATEVLPFGRRTRVNATLAAMFGVAGERWASIIRRRQPGRWVRHTVERSERKDAALPEEDGVRQSLAGQT